jgi:hypothetical protein
MSLEHGLSLLGNHFRKGEQAMHKPVGKWKGLVGWSVLLGLLLSLLAGTQTASGRHPVAASQSGPLLPHFDRRNFGNNSNEVTNSYFFFPQHAQFLYKGFEEKALVSTLVVTGKRVTIDGVWCAVVTEVIHFAENGSLFEQTEDYYAQDKWGNVWYLGEQTKEGTDTTGSWIAGVHGARPGWIMPAHTKLKVGMAYYQEYAPQDQAMDQALIIGVNQTVRLSGVSYTNVLVTKETSKLSPGLVEVKYYVPGFGFLYSNATQGGPEWFQLWKVELPTA